MCEGELNLNTMYKVKGKIEGNEIFKKSAVLDHRKDDGKAIVSSTSNSLDKTSDTSNITSRTIPNQDLKSADENYALKKSSKVDIIWGETRSLL